MDATQQTLPLPKFNTTHASAAVTRNLVQEPGSLIDHFSAEGLHLLPLSPEFNRILARLEALKGPAPSSPVNDMFLCPPLTTKPFKPRQFDTPEEEEAWWSNPRTYPGDHLVAASDAPLSLSVNDTISRKSYITFPSPEPSKCGDCDQEVTDPLQILLTSFRPVHCREKSPSSDESDDSKIAILSDADLEVPSMAGQDISTDAPPNPCAHRPLMPGNHVSHSVEDLSDDGDVDSDSDSDDEYSPDTAGPAHRTRASHTRRAALNPRPAPPTKGTRTYKPRTKTPKDTKPPPKRREFVSIPLQKLQMLRKEENRLRASGEEPPPFELPKPSRSYPDSRYQCPHIQDGKRCKITSGRQLEACRHLLTHFDLHSLCINPQCPRTFARDDSMKRHMNDTECKNPKNHPRGVTTDSYDGTVIKEREVYRLVRIVWKENDIS